MKKRWIVISILLLMIVGVSGAIAATNDDFELSWFTMDGGGGNHSLFAKAFIATLESNEGILEGYSLYYQVLDRMNAGDDADQVPQYAPIHLAGHESGEFFFSPI